MIDFRPSEDQLAMKEAARSFAQRELKPLVKELEQLTDPWECFRRTRDVYRKAAKLGLTRGFIPKEYGGLGLGALDYAVASEELVKVDLGVPATILANGLALAPLIYFGTETQKRKWLTEYCNGQDAEDGPYLCTYGFTDADGAANFDSLDPKAGFRTFAELDGDHYVINGSKYFSTNGTGWDRKGAWAYSVFCRTDPQKNARENLSVVMVPGNTPGITVGRVENKLGIRLSVQPEVIFENVRVPRENLIGKEGDGIAMMNRAYNWRGALLGIGGVGTMQAAFEYCLNFAKHDKRGGTKPIIHHQNVGFMLANMKMRIEAARYMVWRACHWVDTHGADGAEMPVLAKVFCSEIAVEVCRDALYLMGVNGYVKDHPIERYLRDALGLPISDAGNMGVRRRQLHGLMLHSDYDPNAIVNDTLMPFDNMQASEV
jgi:nitroalkane oxidase